MPLRSPSKLWGSGGFTVKWRSSIVRAVKIGWGRRDADAGVGGVAGARGILVHAPAPHAALVRASLALRLEEHLLAPHVRRVGGDEGVALANQRLVEQLTPEPEVGERSPVPVDALDVELEPHALAVQLAHREPRGRHRVALDGFTGRHRLGRVDPDQAHRETPPPERDLDGVAVGHAGDERVRPVAVVPARGGGPSPRWRRPVPVGARSRARDQQEERAEDDVAEDAVRDHGVKGRTIHVRHAFASSVSGMRG